MPDTTAKIRPKGLEATGVTEDLAAEMFTRVGKHYMAIVELKVEEPHGPTADGRRRVDLVLTQVEPAVDANVEDHLRELTRTMHQNRALRSEDAQLQIDTGDDISPRPADVIKAGQQHVAHEYVDGPDGCEICTKPSDDKLHIITDALEDPEPDDDDEPGDLDDEMDPDAQAAAREEHEDLDGQPDEADQAWADGYPEGEPPTRPLSSVPDPFTTTG